MPNPEPNPAPTLPEGEKPQPDFPIPRMDALNAECVDCRRKNARDFLAGNTPGVMAHYAPDARVDDREGWVESDETVERLREWRVESPH